MDHAVWQEKLLEAVAGLGEEGSAAAAYLSEHRTRIGFIKVGKSAGALWMPFRNIRLNSYYYNYDTPLDDLKLKTLIIHEAWHLQQGYVKALSVYGELEAWQLEFRVYHNVKGRYPHPAIAELMTLPLEYDRNVMKQAAACMQAYGGKGYRIDLYPIYPIGREITYWITRT
jgi:hypothetical protein